MAEDSCMLDYLEHSFRSIHKVNVLVSGGAVEMNGALCRNILNHELQSTHDFLMLNLEKLYVKDIVDDKRRVALLQLYAVVKRAESLVQQCCESDTSTWPERALSLYSIKDHVLDIVLHLRWWTSVLDLVIDSVMSKQPNSPNMQHVEIKRLQLANEEFEETLKVMALFTIMESPSTGRVRRARLNDRKPTLLEITEQHGPTRFTGEQLGTKEHLDFILDYNFSGSENIMRPSRRLQAHRFDSNTFRGVLTRCIDLQNAALEDRNDLLTKTATLMESKEPGHLLATQVHSLLTDVEVDGIPELDEFHHESDIAKGVSRVTWCGRQCVLKQICNDAEDQTEAKSLKRFSHPHFVKFYRHFVATGDEDRPQLHILMEPMPMDLAEHMRQVKESPSLSTQPFSEPVAVDVMVQMAQAMWHMHNSYVVHRDLKPGNILVRRVSPEEVPELFAEGYVVVKLGDYGVARESQNSLYRAPEFATQGVKNAVQLKHPLKADLWSFGVVSLEVLSGEVPVFGGDESSPLQGEIQKGAKPRIPEGCPDYLRLCIESCWKSEPLERPGFSEVWRMLRIAKLRSLGLINHNYNWFMSQPERSEHVLSTTIRLEHQSRSGHVHLILPESSSSTSLATRPSRTKKPAKGNFSFLMSIFLKFKMFGRPKLTPDEDQGLDIHIVSPHRHPFGNLTNRVWPRERVSDWKLDVIFFEGNVGARKSLSCRDTWLQRNEPKVFWPRDWLPQDVHKNIRVLVLEYCISGKWTEGLLTDIKKSLIFSDRWNQKRTWQRPIVLVGHSLGCTVIEALVMDLDRVARQPTEDPTADYDKKKAETSRAFLSSLRGCFFYAYPSYGLVRSNAFLKDVFGGLNHSGELFGPEFWEGSERLQKRSAAFLEYAEARNPKISLASLVEGNYTRGRFVVQRRLYPPQYVLKIDQSLQLEDSNHIDICKPVNREHPSYQELVKFLKKQVTVPGHSEGP